MREVLGTIAMITSLVFMAMGLPVQIRKIHRAESTEGVSLFTQCTLFATTVAWCVYSLAISNWYIFVSNAPGAICAFIILCQFWVYRSVEEQDDTMDVTKEKIFLQEVAPGISEYVIPEPRCNPNDLMYPGAYENHLMIGEQILAFLKSKGVAFLGDNILDEMLTGQRPVPAGWEKQKTYFMGEVVEIPERFVRVLVKTSTGWHDSYEALSNHFLPGARVAIKN